MKYFNCHTHTFNMQYVPEKFLTLQTSPHIANALHWILSKSWIADPLLWLSKFFFKGGKAKMVAFLKIGLKKTQDMVFADLCSNYPKEDEVKYIVLPIDFTFMGAGALKIPYKQQLDDLFALKLKYPDKCYPFVAIDPRSGTASENKKFVESWINKGFSGIKLYPALGYFAFDENLKEVYQYAQENAIPLMTHASSGGINYAEDKAPDSFIYPKPFHTLPGKSYTFPQAGHNKKMKDYCDQFNDPANYEEVFLRFPRLKICFAHFGLNSDKKFNDDGLGWFDKILDLMKRYDNIYADVSYSIAYKGFCDFFLKRYNSDAWPESVKNRILYGTDYFMTVQEEFGNDDEILKAAKEGLKEDIFLRLAYTNVVSFLQRP